MEQTVAPCLLSVVGAAARLGVSRRTIEREIADGFLPVVRIRGTVRIALADIDHYIAANKAARAKPLPGADVCKRTAEPVSRDGSAELDQLLQKRSRSKARAAAGAP